MTRPAAAGAVGVGTPGLSGPEEGCSRKDCGGSLVSRGSRRRGRSVSEGSRRNKSQTSCRKEGDPWAAFPSSKSPEPGSGLGALVVWGPASGVGAATEALEGLSSPPPCCGGGARSSSPRCHGYQSSQLPSIGSAGELAPSAWPALPCSLRISPSSEESAPHTAAAGALGLRGTGGGAGSRRGHERPQEAA